MTSLVRKEHNFLDFTDEKIKLLKQTVCKGATDNELQLFLHVCVKTGLDPFIRQIYSVPRGGQRTIQTGIDGYRVIAERTGRYAPGREPTYHYDDKGNLISATAYVKKQTQDGTWHEVCATAFWGEYKGESPFWKKMPNNQLAKCAEALALRKAFPSELSGIYTKEEMDQASKIEAAEMVDLPLKEEPASTQKRDVMLGYHPKARAYLDEICKIHASFSEDEIIERADLDKFKVSFDDWLKRQEEASA
jgi:phage recombination protein Bet